jgi:hypothetical protein
MKNKPEVVDLLLEKVLWTLGSDYRCVRNSGIVRSKRKKTFGYATYILCTYRNFPRKSNMPP